MNEPKAKAPAEPAPVPPELEPKEKAKMDYQASLDETKAVGDHGRRWKDIWWDKLAIGAGAAFFALLVTLPINCAMEKSRQTDAHALEQSRQDEARALEKSGQKEARALETFRLDEARQRFVAEKRLAALFQIQAAFSA